MHSIITATGVEFSKNRHSKITWMTFASFALAPIMGGVFALIVRNPEVMSKVGALRTKADTLNFLPDWNSYFSLLSQAVGVGGVLVFGFVSSWIFGREYSEGTLKDLLSLPVSRKSIVDAKFLTYVIWCVALSLSNIIVALIVGTALNLDGWNEVDLRTTLETYMLTTLLTIMIGAPVSFFAMIGEGYMAPLGFVAFTLVFAQIIAATGFGSYFPWSIPGLYSGAAGEYRSQLNWISYSILTVVSLSGYLGSLFWFQFADQDK
jgi:ABC-type transport system involved in multi-copper enzyme maturation permease subunit